MTRYMRRKMSKRNMLMRIGNVKIRIRIRQVLILIVK